MDFSIPAPIGGWNSRDALDLMPPTDAISLINLIPRETSVETRKGTDEIIGTGYDVFETLLTYNGSGGNQLLAIGEATASGSSNLYLIDPVAKTATSKGAMQATVLTGQNRWQYININDKLVMVSDGVITPFQYDGTTLASIGTFSGASGAIQKSFTGVVGFKGRAYYWAEGANSFWHAAAGAYTGALTEFAIDFVTQRGGGIKEIVTWTRDSGDGMDDWFVVLMNTGETLVYNGTDPASDFTLQGVFQLGEPLSIRGSCKLASDRIVITRDGYINLSNSLQTARLQEAGHVGSKIVNRVKELIDLYSDNYGWEIKFFPSQSLLMVNVPIDIVTPSPTYEQHVMNTNTGKWCSFTGWNAVTFTEYENEVYYCTSEGAIYKAFTGVSDNDAFIYNECVPAFNSFQMPTSKKQLTVCTVISDFYAPKYIAVDGHSEFNINASLPLNYPNESNGELWNVPDWDEPFWDDGVTGAGKITSHVFPVSAFGYSVTVKIRHATKKQTVKYYSFKLKFKKARTI